MNSEEIKKLTEGSIETLMASLSQGKSESLVQYLRMVARFHRYSLHNVLLIALQKPNASYVAGFRTWNKLGRFVRKGEKGILILAPMIKRIAEEDACHPRNRSDAYRWLSWRLRIRRKSDRRRTASIAWHGLGQSWHSPHPPNRIRFVGGNLGRAFERHRSGEGSFPGWKDPVAARYGAGRRVRHSRARSRTRTAAPRG